MRTDLDHLPANKQREIERVKAIIFEEFEDAIALATQSWKKKGRIEKILLYGSYARGGWITRQLEHFDQWRPRTPPRQYISGETHLYLGKQYRLLVIEAEQTGVSLNGDRMIMWTHGGATYAYRRAILSHWYKLQAHRIIPPRVDAAWHAFSSKLRQRPALIIREMTQRWGSYTPAGRLVLNTELVRASSELIDYVVTHELAHGVHRDHGAPWQALMSEKMPDWRDRKAALERQLL